MLGILRTGYIIAKATSALKQPSLDERIKVLNGEIFKTHEKLGLARNSIHDALAKNAKVITPEFISTTNALNKQIKNHNNAAENLVTELGELIPTY